MLAFFLLLAPTSSVLPIVTEIAAEHRMYLPLAVIIAALVSATPLSFRSPSTETAKIAVASLAMAAANLHLPSCKCALTIRFVVGVCSTMASLTDHACQCRSRGIGRPAAAGDHAA